MQTLFLLVAGMGLWTAISVLKNEYSNKKLIIWFDQIIFIIYSMNQIFGYHLRSNIWMRSNRDGLVIYFHIDQSEVRIFKPWSFSRVNFNITTRCPLPFHNTKDHHSYEFHQIFITSIISSLSVIFIISSIIPLASQYLRMLKMNCQLRVLQSMLERRIWMLKP